MDKQTWESHTDPTEMVEWIKDYFLASNLVQPLSGKAMERKMRLFALACWAHAYATRTKGGRQADYESLDAGYRIADGLVQVRDRRFIATRRDSGFPHYSYLRDDVWEVAGEAADRAHLLCDGGSCPKEMVCHYLRDIINPFVYVYVDSLKAELGSWYPEVEALAQAAYGIWQECQSCRGQLPRPGRCVCGGSRVDPFRYLDPVRLAVLADALEEAGCVGKHEWQKTPFPNTTAPCIRCGVEWASDAHRAVGDECPHPILAHLRKPVMHTRGCWAVDYLIGKSG